MDSEALDVTASHDSQHKAGCSTPEPSHIAGGGLSSRQPIFSVYNNKPDDGNVVEASPFWAPMGRRTSGLNWDSLQPDARAASPISDRTDCGRPLFAGIDITTADRAEARATLGILSREDRVGGGMSSASSSNSGSRDGGCSPVGMRDEGSFDGFAANRYGHLDSMSFSCRRGGGGTSCSDEEKDEREGRDVLNAGLRHLEGNGIGGGGRVLSGLINLTLDDDEEEDEDASDGDDDGGEMGKEQDLPQLVADLKLRLNMTTNHRKSLTHSLKEQETSLSELEGVVNCDKSLQGSTQKNRTENHITALHADATEQYPGEQSIANAKCRGLIDNLNQSLEQCGFSTLPTGSTKGEDIELSSIVTSFASVLEQYNRKDELARQLLKENESWMVQQEGMEAQLGELSLEKDEALKDAEKSIDHLQKEKQSISCEVEKERAMGAKLGSQLKKLQSKISEIENESKRKEQELSTLKRQMSVSSKERTSCTAKERRATESMKNLESQVHQMTHQIRCLENANRTKDAELSKLHAASSPLTMTPYTKNNEKEAIARLESEIQRLRHQIKEAEKDKEQDVARWKQTCNQTEQSLKISESEEKRAQGKIAKLDNEIKKLKTQNTDLDYQLRVKDEEVRTLQQEERHFSSTLQKNNDCVEALKKQCSQQEAETGHMKQLMASLEDDLRSKDEEIANRKSSEQDAKRRGLEAVEQMSRLQEQIQKGDSELQYWKQKAFMMDQEHKKKVLELEAKLKEKDDLRNTCDEASACYQQAIEDLKSARNDVQNAKQLNTQLDHSLRSHEQTIQKLKARLNDKVEKDRRRIQRDEDVYERIRQAHISSKSNLSTRAGAVMMASRQLRPIEIVGIYESKQETMQWELAALRGETRSLANDLRDTQNKLAAKERSGLCRNIPEEKVLARIDIAERRVSELLHELNNARAQAADSQRTAVRKTAELERRIETLVDENSSLLLELESRPSVKDMKAVQRQVEIMEKRLLKANQTGGAGAAAEARERDLQLSTVVAGPLTTRERIGRDKDLHRLNLHAVDDIPKDVLMHIIQDMCISLELNDPSQLPATTMKLLRVVSSLPRLEAFVGQVCEIVLHTGKHFLPKGMSSADPSSIPKILQMWIGQLERMQSEMQTMEMIRKELSKRVDGSSRPLDRPSELLQGVKQLVQHEHNSLLAVETIQSATNAIACDPDNLIHRIVEHFQKLFGCGNLEGVIPSMNKAYMAVTESRNFLRSLSAILGLSSGSGTAACLNRVRQLLDDHGRTLDLKENYIDILRSGKENSSRGNDAFKKSNCVNHSKDEMGQMIISGLASLFRVQDIDEIPSHAKKLVDRLSRLDEVMPKYQKLTGRLYDLLRVRTMDEILPAVKVLVGR